MFLAKILWKKDKLVKKDIERQIDDFYMYACKRYSDCVAAQYREYLILFIRVTDRESVFDVKKEDIKLFRQWIHEHYSASPVYLTDSIRALEGFLRFFRCLKYLRN